MIIAGYRWLVKPVVATAGMQWKGVTAMMTELIMAERQQELARMIEQRRVVEEALAGRRAERPRVGPLRGRLGRWLVASGRQLLADGE